MNQPPTSAPLPPRLVSLDAYRGFVMLLMMAGLTLGFVSVARALPESGVWAFLAPPYQLQSILVAGFVAVLLGYSLPRIYLNLTARARPTRPRHQSNDRVIDSRVTEWDQYPAGDNLTA